MMSLDANALRQTVTVKPSHGLHLGPCSVIARLALQFKQCTIMLSKAGKKADAKSVFDMMTLEAHCGDELELEITGEEAPAALEQFVQLFDHDFFPIPTTGPGSGMSLK